MSLDQMSNEVTPADRLARLKYIVGHIMDMWPAVLNRRFYMKALARNEKLRDALELTHAAHVHNALQSVLLTDLIIQIGALVLDGGRGSASVARALSALRDPELVELLHADYKVVPPIPRVHNDAELDEETRAEVARVLHESELRRSLSEFDTLNARLPQIAADVLESNVAKKLELARNKGVAHYDVVREGTDWRLWSVGGTGLTYGEVDAYIDMCTGAIDTLNMLVRRASYVFEELAEIAQTNVDEYSDALAIGLLSKKETQRAEFEKRIASLRARDK